MCIRDRSGDGGASARAGQGVLRHARRERPKDDRGVDEPMAFAAADAHGGLLAEAPGWRVGVGASELERVRGAGARAPAPRAAHVRGRA